MKSEKKPNLFLALWEVLKLLFAPASPAPDSLRQMVEQTLDAIRLKDTELYYQQALPESLALKTPENQDFFDWQLKKDFERDLPDDFTVGVILLDVRKDPLFDDFLDYPVKPTHVAKVQFKKGQKHTTLYWQVVERDGRWFMVLPVPDPALKDLGKAGMVSTKKQDEEAEELYYRLDPGILSEIRARLEKGKSLEAIKYCQSKTGKNLAVAKKIVEFVEKR